MVFISSSCVQNNNIVEVVNILKNITDNIELSGGTKIQKNMLETLLELKSKEHINFLVHSYFPPPKEDFVLNFADVSSRTREFIAHSMRYVNELNVEYYSVHAGFKKDFTIANERLVNGVNSFTIEGIQENISWFHTNFQKKLALENLFPNGQSEACFASHIDEIEEVLNLNAKIFLLLDLGHLKVSANYYGFDYMDAVTLLFEKYADRILEIHLSENDGVEDDHLIIESTGIQYKILERFKNHIQDNKINLVIEARGYTTNELRDCYNLLNKTIGE